MCNSCLFPGDLRTDSFYGGRAGFSAIKTVTLLGVIKADGERMFYCTALQFPQITDKSGCKE